MHVCVPMCVCRHVVDTSTWTRETADGCCVGARVTGCSGPLGVPCCSWLLPRARVSTLIFLKKSSPCWEAVRPNLMCSQPGTAARHQEIYWLGLWPFVLDLLSGPRVPLPGSSLSCSLPLPATAQEGQAPHSCRSPALGVSAAALEVMDTSVGVSARGPGGRGRVSVGWAATETVPSCSDQPAWGQSHPPPSPELHPIEGTHGSGTWGPVLASPLSLQCFCLLPHKVEVPCPGAHIAAQCQGGFHQASRASLGQSCLCIPSAQSLGTWPWPGHSDGPKGQLLWP